GNSTSLEGIRLVSAFSRGDQFGWTVGIGQPRSELAGPIVSQVRNRLAVGIVLLAIALVLALYAAQGIARPVGLLRRLAETADWETRSNTTMTGLPETDVVARALFTAQENRRRSRQTEALLQDAIDSIPEGFSIYDSTDHLVMCNRSYRDLFADSSDHVM